VGLQPHCFSHNNSSSIFILIFLIHVTLKDELDIDPNDQSSILQHIDKVLCGYYQYIFNESSYLVPHSGYSYNNLFLFNCDKNWLLCFRVCFGTTKICWNFNFLNYFYAWICDHMCRNYVL